MAEEAAASSASRAAWTCAENSRANSLEMPERGGSHSFGALFPRVEAACPRQDESEDEGEDEDGEGRSHRTGTCIAPYFTLLK